MSKVHVETTINDEATEFLCEPNQPLLEVLRDTLGLTGTKEGCSTGDCGACSITLDGRLVCSRARAECDRCLFMCFYKATHGHTCCTDAYSLLVDHVEHELDVAAHHPRVA